MSIQEYFEQPDTPGRNSPVGVLMERVLTKNPAMNFEQARQEAHALLDRAAGRRAYTIPKALSAEEQEEMKTRLRTAFGGLGTARGPRRSGNAGISSLRGHKNSARLVVGGLEGAQR